MMNAILCQATLEFWEKLAGGQVGFILATLIFGAFYWRVILPAQQKLADAVNRMTEAMNKLILITENKSSAALEKIFEKLNQK